ncbi:MAG: hypothetical protein JWP08_4032 [Bryobacterales bacterium]|nr:hypothetical protein [Bryobacterales bacterium]
MKVQFRITLKLLKEIRTDLNRPHAFALERVGFIYCRFAWLSKSELVILAHDYEPVDDAHYEDDREFGAVIGVGAFRRVLTRTYHEKLGIFHVHSHGGKGVPRPSGPDMSETAKFVPDFFHGRRDVPHGAMIFSDDALSGRVWLSEDDRKPKTFTSCRVTGWPLSWWQKS